MRTVQRGLTVGSSYSHVKRTRAGKINPIQGKYVHAIWKKALFLMGLATLLVLASGVIITLGQVPMTVPEVYYTR